MLGVACRKKLFHQQGQLGGERSEQATQSQATTLEAAGDKEV